MKTRKLRESATRNEELMREEALLANRERDTLKEELEKMRQTLEERDAEIRDLNEDKRKSTREIQKKIESERKLSSQLKDISERLVNVDSEIVPKFERTVNELNERLSSKDKEIVKFLAEVKALKSDLEETARKGESFRKEANLKRRNAEKSQQLVKRFQRDLFQVVERKAREDFKSLKDAVVQLYSRYAPEEDTKENEIHLTRSEETVLTVQKRNDVLEKTVDKLRKQLIKESEARRAEVSKVLKENLELVNAEQQRKKEKKTREREDKDRGEHQQSFSELKRYLYALHARNAGNLRSYNPKPVQIEILHVHVFASKHSRDNFACFSIQSTPIRSFHLHRRQSLLLSSQSIVRLTQYVFDKDKLACLWLQHALHLL